MRGWDEGEGDRDESRRRLREALSQSKSDLSRSWKIYRRSLLAMLGLFMVISVSLVAIFAETIAVEHPYRNLQDTEDKWLIDYEPRRADPRSEECDWHEQKITTNPNSPLFSEIVVAESDDKVGETIANGYYRDTLTVIQLIKLEDPLGYDLNLSLLSIDPSNSSLLVLSPELYGNTSLYGGVWVTYEFDNEEMHHWWLPDGYDVCIFGTNDQGHDLFSKVVYGAQVSLKIGITVATLTVIIGTIVGSISGYFGGRVDEVIMRICDIFFAIPGLILAMAFVAAMNQITSLTIPIWLGILFPIFVLAAFSNTYLNSTVPDDDQISEQAMRLLMRYRGVLLALVGLLFFIGWIPGASWPDFFGISEGRSWRIFAAVGIIAVLGAIILADRRFFLNTSFEGPHQGLLRLDEPMEVPDIQDIGGVRVPIAAVQLLRERGRGDSPDQELRSPLEGAGSTHFHRLAGLC